MSEEQNSKQAVDEKRREFLRKSIYAAYATPFIATLLVAKNSAAFSGAIPPGQCKPPAQWLGPQNTGCCDTNNDGRCG